MEYVIKGLENDGCELVSRVEYTLKAAKAEARIILTDPEYIGAGLHKVEVQDGYGVCLFDLFVVRHYQTGRGTLCSLDNDASIRTPTADKSTVTCPYCLAQMRHARPA